MTKSEVIRRIRDVGVIPVVRATTADDARRVVEAIRAGGVPIVEITLTVPDAVRVIEHLARAWGDAATVGAGSVLDGESARACIAAGARFVVSPALNAGVVSCCREQDVTVMPGALTPTEVMAAWDAGADFVKVFPADALGGPRYIRSLKAPLPQVALVPTGGVTLANAADFIGAGAAAIGVGADLVDIDAVLRGDAAKVTAAARNYLDAVRGARHPARRA